MCYWTQANNHWKARQEWIQPLVRSDNNDNRNKKNMDSIPTMQPNYDYLKTLFGKVEVQVADCEERDFTNQKRTFMPFDKFVDLWQKQPQRYYLKDWHFVKSFPNQDMYQVPDIFVDDWMNEYWQKETEDDYRFSYMGGDGTFTPFHADVFRSYSWSSNICGVKKWTLFPPNQEDFYKDKLGNMVYDIRNVDSNQFQQFSKAKKLVLYQKDGETVFVPSGWYHQVENIGGTISINHNWFNACNIEQCYQSLSNDLKDVEQSIEDLKKDMDKNDFINTCQQLLLAHSGWNWMILNKLLDCILNRLNENKDTNNHNTLQPPYQWQIDKIENIRNKLKEESSHFVQ
ncbi:unnamed protein product [Cunninghamella blakesleeana]